MPGTLILCAFGCKRQASANARVITFLQRSEERGTRSALVPLHKTRLANCTGKSVRRAVTPRFIMSGKRIGKAAARIVGCPPQNQYPEIACCCGTRVAKKPGGVGAVPFGEGVGVSPDIIDNIAEDGVAQGSVLYDVGDVGAECFAQSGVEGGKLREAEGFITEALHQIGEIYSAARRSSAATMAGCSSSYRSHVAAPEARGGYGPVSERAWSGSSRKVACRAIRQRRQAAG